VPRGRDPAGNCSVLNASLNCRPGSILVVEADSTLRRSLVEWLRSAVAEYTILEAATKEQAAIVAQSESPSMIVVDIACPCTDGEETVREIKRAAPWATVVALTMCDDRGYCDQLLSAGADESVLIWESRAELPLMIKARLARDGHEQDSQEA